MVSKCFTFMHFLFPHWVPATWRSLAQTSMRTELPSGKQPTAQGTAAYFPVKPFNDIIGTDARPAFTGKITVGARFFDAVFYFLGGLFRFHRTKIFHHGFCFLPGSFCRLLSEWCVVALFCQGPANHVSFCETYSTLSCQMFSNGILLKQTDILADLQQRTPASPVSFAV